DLGQQNLIPSLFEHQGVGQVVDILRGAGKVHELGYLLQHRELRLAGGELFLDQVFNGFDVVIGGALDRFDAAGVFFAKAADQLIEVGMRCCVEFGHLGNL